jgi:hypothetical protein
MAFDQKRLLEHLVSNVATLAVAWLLIGQTRVEVEPAYVEVLQADLIQLRRDYNQQTAELVTATIRIAELERLVGGSSVDDIEGSAIYAFLERIERPAWCKSVQYTDTNELPSFRMEYPNRSYEQRYGKTAAAYSGKTDFEIWPPEIAEAYYQNDLRSWATKDYLEFLEPTILNDTLGWFAKWWFALPSGREFICGMEVARQNAEGQYAPRLRE